MSARRKRRPPPTSRAEKDQVTLDAIEDAARSVHGVVKGHRAPSLEFPIRSLSNVSYDPKVGYLEIGDAVAKRTLTVNTAKSFAQTLLMMQLAHKHIRIDEHSTKREAYYISKNWGDARFAEQPESDTVLDDVEAMFARHGVTREQLRFTAEDHGGSVAGELVIIEPDPETGEDVYTDCAGFASGSYTIPCDVEGLRFESAAKFVLCVETGGSFDRLHRARFWRKHQCILISMGGVPTRACRRFVRRVSDFLDIPVYAFTDCDPYGIANIYRTLKVGSGNAAHINRFYCVPRVKFLGVTPQDIVDYELPTHPLQEVDIKRAKDALKNDPFFMSHKPWIKAIEQMIRSGQRAEQQAFAQHGLAFVHERYLPEKLASPKKFLP